MKKVLLLLLVVLLASPSAEAADKVVVVPLNSAVKAIINPKEIGNHYVVIGPSSFTEVQVPSDSTYILTDLIGSNHLFITVQVNDTMKLDLTSFSEKNLSMRSGIACAPGSTIKMTNTTGTVTAVTLSGYYY